MCWVYLLARTWSALAIKVGLVGVNVQRRMVPIRQGGTAECLSFWKRCRSLHHFSLNREHQFQFVFAVEFEHWGTVGKTDWIIGPR